MSKKKVVINMENQQGNSAFANFISVVFELIVFLGIAYLIYRFFIIGG